MKDFELSGSDLGTFKIPMEVAFWLEENVEGSDSVEKKAVKHFRGLIETEIAQITEKR